jgi:hypothetical protein
MNISFVAVWLVDTTVVVVVMMIPVKPTVAIIGYNSHAVSTTMIEV